MKTYSDIAEMLLNKGLLVIFKLLCFSAVSFTACPQSLYTDSQGTIQSPGFNTTGRYDANMSCTYNIRVSPGRRITLEFKNLSILGSMPNCMEDSVEIFVGCSNTSIGKFCSCSNLSMPKIYSYDNCMTLVFTSDGSNEGKGFEAQYTTANNTAARLDPKNCSTDSVTPSYGTIYTPNWPLTYPANVSCVWTFNPPPTTIVRFFFTGFDLDGDPICDPNRPPQTGDQISIIGTNTRGGQVIVEKRLCRMPADAFFPIKNMKAIEVRFGSNSVRTNDGTGVMAGYATYIKGNVDSSASRSGFTGPSCETDIDECNNTNPCNCGKCVNVPGSYRCDCDLLTTGVHCEIDINECDNKSICSVEPAHQGICFNFNVPTFWTCNDPKRIGYQCLCRNGFRGHNCEVNVDDCFSSPCQNGAACKDGVFHYSCTCAAGWTGKNCETDVNECDQKVCQNGASCKNLDGTYNCTCMPGFTDFNCSTDIDECASNPCVCGNCTDLINGFNCTCFPGYTASCPPSLYTDSQGTIQSPGFNTTGRYDANMSCTYNIRVPAGRRIILEFKNLSILGSMPNCAEDSVEIMIGCSNTSIGKFCSCSNLSIPDKIYSYDNCMTLVFKSDGSNQGKGFEAQYTTADNTARLDPKNCSTDSVTPSHGTIYTPNWPLKYPESASCVWTFNPPPTTIVRFFFTGFDLDKDPICDPNRPPQTGDHISITGTNTTGGQIIVEKRLCTLPADAFFPIKDMKTIEVRFGSNSVRTNDGTGVMAGYATYIKGYVKSSASRCELVDPTLKVVPCPPQNVTVVSQSSRVVNISWTTGFDGNSEILNYTVKIRDNQNFGPGTCQGLSSSACVVSGNITSALLTGLHPGRTYYIKVFATNKVGSSAASSVVNTTTDEEEPDGAPQNVRGRNTSSTSISVSWDPVPAEQQNGVITGYTIVYQSLTENHNGNVPAGPSELNKEITRLKEYVVYHITVFASTVKGPGPPSSPVLVVRTDQDKPSAPPSNVRIVGTTSTSILVEWNRVSSVERNGIIQSYTIKYQAVGDDRVTVEGPPVNTTVDFPTLRANLRGLIKNQRYNITVLATTIKGDGPYSDYITIPTNQFKPGAAPGDVKGKFDSSTEISVTWGIVPENLQHGDITHYIVTYWKTAGGGQNETERVDAPLRNVKLTGLVKYTLYSINVVAFTVKGGGPASPAIVVRTDEDKPSASPTLISVTVINSTSVFVEWEAVPLSSRNGIITIYTIYFRDEDNKKTGTKDVSFPAINATVNGLRQKAEYSFWILASTIKGKGPPSGEEKATTEAIPSVAPPVGEAIGTTEVKIPFVNKETLSDGQPVIFFRIIVTPLRKGDNPGNPADPKYQNVELTYENQQEGKPYNTAEFSKKYAPITEFPVGDGKYYSRETGITDAKRKRRAVSSPVTKYLNGQLNDDTKYAVFQRSFDKDGDYEDEGFIRFETKAKPPIVIIVVVVFALLILAVAVIVIIWCRRYYHNDTKSDASNLKDGSRKEIIEMSGNINPATEASYYNSIQLHDEPADPQQLSGQLTPPTEGQVTYEEVQSHQDTDYDDINPKQEDIYQEIKDETHYRSLDLHRPADYEELSQLQCKAVDHYQPLDKVDKHIYGSQSPC